MAPSLRHRQSEPLSPRQLFQNQVRSLSAEDTTKGHHRNKSIHLKYNPYELQHVSSLRVQTHHNRSTSRSPANSRIPALRQVQEEPDFVLEEREAWSRRSPTTKAQASPRQQQQQQTQPFLIYDETLSEDERPVGRQLPTFAPSQHTTDVNDRPKTSRGFVSAILPPLTVSDAPSNNDPPGSSPVRTRFVEGSMTNRSQGTSSSWTDHASDYDTSASDTEDDSTPKASGNRRSSSVDIDDFNPPSASSSTVRRTLFRRRSSTKPVEEQPKPKNEKRKAMGEGEGEKRPRRHLRKSLSSWSLHGLGEKMGLFNASSSSIDAGAIEAEKEAAEDSSNHEALLDERKRKAEIAYAQQFGSKKQKDNAGFATAIPNAETYSDKNATIRGRSAAHDPNATIRARSTHPARRTSLGPSDLADVFCQDGSADHDIRKRPSRRELEKENQQLREMLRRSQSGHFASEALHQQPKQTRPQVSTTLPTSTGPVGARKVVPPPRLSSNRRSSDTLRTTPSQPGLSTGHAVQQAPIGKQAVSEQIMKQHGQYPLDLSTRPSLPELPRKVDMIIEEPEGEDDKAKAGSIQRMRRSSSNKHRRHSMHLGDPQKITTAVGKENSKPLELSNVPAIVVSTSTDGSPAHKNEWQGWDDDVF